MILTIQTELAWAAGFFDGEGSTYLIKTRHKNKNGTTRRYNYLGLAVTQTGEELLYRFGNAVGFPGRVLGPFKKEPWAPQWAYRANGNHAWEILHRLWPYLGSVKRAQAQRIKDQATGRVQ